MPDALRRLMVEVGVADLLESNRHQVRGSQATPAHLLAICGALPFMDSHRLVVVDGLLAAFEPRIGERRGGRAQGRRRAGGQQGPSLGGWEELQQAVPEMPETTLLVFTDGPISEGNSLLRLLRQVCRVQSLNAPSEKRWPGGSRSRLVRGQHKLAPPLSNC